MKLRLKRALHKATRVTAAVATIALILGIYMAGSYRDVGLLDSIYDNEVPAAPPLTVWDMIHNDTRISRFAKILGEFDDIVEGLKAVNAKFTVYAPTDEAFEKEEFAQDLPWFYWKFLIGYHMGPGAYSEESLLSTNTVPSFVNADIFFKYRQRISTQSKPGALLFNHKAKYVTANIAAVNGFVHHIDSLLMLPDSTSDILRSWADFSTLRKGLIETGIAVTINDTSTHVGQTLFAPSNTAFKKLGSDVNRFLFSPWGTKYLKALLKYHVVANRTMFSDVYFQANGQGQITLTEGSMFDLPTLLSNASLSTVINSDGSRLCIKVDDAVSVDQADIVVMDGVIHRIDSLLMPPVSANDSRKARKSSWFSFPWLKDEILTVKEVMEILQPFVENAD